MRQQLLHGDLTERIIGVFFQVHWELGHGFLESIYANGMHCGLAEARLRVQREVPVSVHFRGRRIGMFRADMIVESVVLLEFKTGERLDPMAGAQLLNYLRATRIEVGLILHFGPRPAFKRFIQTNDRKIIP
ncbi:MAG TPA: GxxExxY protein [Gemmatimonadaceae bacterium]|nr:GxxExxY protein [Gemmatimonadaceae bacterium]